MENMTKTAKALQIIATEPGIGAKKFALLYFTEPKHEYLFTAVSQQGNGACAGKKAWLCAGSLLGRLRKSGYIRMTFYPNRYYITEKGKQFLDTKEQK